MQKTYSAKPSDVHRKWYVIDASETTLGRVATKAASLLIGKGKAQFTSHIDTGDYVIVINADKLQVTGNKLESKMYYHHSGFAGGLKARSLKDQMQRDSTQAIIAAVNGMLPINKLREGRMERLKVYSGNEHRHEAQKPEILSVKDAK